MDKIQMETFFGFLGFAVSAVCFAVGACVILYGAFDAIRFVQRKLTQAVNPQVPTVQQ